MKKVLLVTDVDFWRMGAGHRTRIESLVNYLCDKTELTIVYLGRQQPKDIFSLWRRRRLYQFFFLEKNRQLSLLEYLERLSAFLRNYQPDVCILEYLRLSFLRECLPAKTKTILDTHDLISERSKTFIRYGYEHDPMDLEEELVIFRDFDKVMFIQQEEYRKVLPTLGEEVALLVPHPVDFNAQPIRNEVKCIGFVGSDYTPNVDGIRWFLGQVWPRLAGDRAILHIYGSVSDQLKKNEYPGVRLHGFVRNLEKVYQRMDIMINPVRFGAGLKIKNLEALGHGLPLVTTPHAACGLLHGETAPFCTAGSADEFVEALQQLITDYDRRKLLGQNAYAFTRNHFSPDRCFQPLWEAICR